jgi:hypothetical protein
VSGMCTAAIVSIIAGAAVKVGGELGLIGRDWISLHSSLRWLPAGRHHMWMFNALIWPTIGFSLV